MVTLTKVSCGFSRTLSTIRESFLFFVCEVSTKNLGNFLIKPLPIQARSGFLRRKLLGNMFPVFPIKVSCWFPKKFPGKSKSFLNPHRGFAMRKQETFDEKPSIHAGVYGFLGWKPFPGQETLSFLESFQRRNEACLW